MSQQYFEISPCLDDKESYVGDWEFTYWPDKPKGDVIKNPDGTFSVVMEKNFTPLVSQLQELFKGGKMPEDGTYLGEAVLYGKKSPNDIVYESGFINGSGLLISSPLLNILKQFKLPKHGIYDVQLIQGKKRHDSYSYINFDKKDTQENHDIKLVGFSTIYVAERIKNEIENAGLTGCEFKIVK